MTTPVSGSLDLDGLRRRPDFEVPDLRAWDTADTMLLDEAAELLPGSEPVVIGDAYGAITLGALLAGATSVRAHQDALSGERALALNAIDAGLESMIPSIEWLPVEPALVAGARLVLVRLPRTVAALDEIAALVAEHAHPDVVVIAAGRLKHMTPTQTERLRARFGRVDVSRARQKSRALIAREPLPLAEAPAAPEVDRTHLEEFGLDVVARPGVFAGARLDIGTRALLDVLDQAPAAKRAIDLGCGTGILAARYRQLHPASRVLASDQSAAAVASATLTMTANGLDVEVTREDALAEQPEASADLVLLNPPFHSGSAVHGETATRLFEAAARVLRPGGELWCVWNSNLGYRARLESAVGPTRQLSRTPKFTVTASIRR